MARSNGAATLPPQTQPGSVARAGAPVAGSPSGSRRRRRMSLVLVGVGAMAVGAWAFAMLWLSAGDRVEVVALASDVEAYEVLERSDLATVRVAEADGVDVVAASAIEELVGRTVRADLPAESLLVEADLFSEDETLVGSDEAVVGAELSDGVVPVELARGREVMVVVRPPATSSGTAEPAESVDAWILNVEELESVAGRSGGVVVSIVVPRGSASAVAAASAEERLSIVALEE